MILKLSKAWLIFWIAVCSLFSVLQLSLRFQLEYALKLGFDSYGRNLFVLIPQAAFKSLVFSFAAVSLTITGALLLASVISLSPKSLKQLLIIGLNTLLAFPSILIALGLAALYGPSWWTLMGALVLGLSPELALLFIYRAQEVLAEDFISAARAVGASSFHLFKAHLFKEWAILIRLKLPSLFSTALLAEASLSFLGLGAPLESESWGLLLAQSYTVLIEAPHIALESGIPLMLTVFALQVMSDTIYFSPNGSRR